MIDEGKAPDVLTTQTPLYERALAAWNHITKVQGVNRIERWNTYSVAQVGLELRNLCFRLLSFRLSGLGLTLSKRLLSEE